jgi:hypothetical protein
LDGEVKLLYSKNIPNIIGDGKSTICSLLLEYLKKTNVFIEKDDIEHDLLSSILPKGKRCRVGWKSNLGKGAVPRILPDCSKRVKLTQFALAAAKALSIRFASVDVIETDNEMRVLEVNSGIMMENFVQAAKENYAIAKGIYQQAIHIMLTS